MTNRIYTLPATAPAASDTPTSSLQVDIERGILGTDRVTIPGSTEDDKQWAYKRTVPTVVLYDEIGLRLYDRITSDAPEYYLFPDELGLFKTHGNEIARAMGFGGHEIGNGSSGSDVDEQPDVDADIDIDSVLEFPPAVLWKNTRWGDAVVGRWNNGVNGEVGMGGGWERGWDVVELGAGALRKTAHLLTALSDALPPTPRPSPRSPPITYHALDLSLPELDRVLGQMGDAIGPALEGRVACIGLHGDYNAGLQFVRHGGLASLASMPTTPDSAPQDDAVLNSPMSALSAHLVTPATDVVSLPRIADDDVSELAQSMGVGSSSSCKWAVPESSSLLRSSTSSPSWCNGAQTAAPGSATTPRRPLHFVFLGSSLGNFERAEAAPFLRSLPLEPGDTLLLGLDGRPPPGPEGKRKVEAAYNDPHGHTRAFEEHGWQVVADELGLQPDAPGIEFVGRYNEILGRHESYFRSKAQQTIHLPVHNVDVVLEDGELLNIEWSYKYSYGEALELFDQADLSVVNSWKAPGSEYRLWLLERPRVHFSNNSYKADQAIIMADHQPNKHSLSLDNALTHTPNWPKAMPTWDDWLSLWKLWDHITLEMIPKDMLHQKPIDLRHICLFYLGHIPTFLDIYLTRMTNGKHSEPEHFKDIFERGIDPDVDDPTKIHSHSEVPTAESDWPSLDEILAFQDRVRARLGRIYDAVKRGDTALSRRLGRTIFMTYEHEGMHAETLLYMLLQSPLTRPPSAGVTPQWDVLARRWAAESASNKVLDVPATVVTLGHNDAEADDAAAVDSADWADHEFGWDNEHPSTAVPVKSFKIDALPITNGQYLAFLQTNATAITPASAPASWVEVDGEWRVRTLYGPVPFSVAGGWPLMASKLELEAYARSRGGRLPTEPELVALWAHPRGPRPAGLTANIGLKHWFPVPPTLTVEDNAGRVVHGHNGGVWEWTSTEFKGLDGYVPSEMYPGYSADFFDGKHYIVLGGSFATVPNIAGRKSFRNWYQANYKFAWVGGRIAYDV